MTVRVTANDNVETLNPKGYINNREITNLDGNYLVKGSQNMRIVNREKVVSSKRYTLLGAAKDVNNGIVTSCDWKMNTGQYRNIRGYTDGSNGELEVWYEEAWTRIKNGFANIEFSWIPWWYPAEQIDVLIGVNNSDKIYMWAGGIAEVASVTANTITKKGYMTGTTIGFNDNGASPDTISDSAGGFLTAGFAAGDVITITGSVSNNGIFTIESVTATLITLIDTNALNTEASGASVVVRWDEGGTWAEAHFLVLQASRKVIIGGQEFTYTGGESTGTLTGITPDPTAFGITAGDRVMSTVMEFEPAALDGLRLNRLGVSEQHMYYGSTRSHKIWISSVDDFADFTFTTPVRVAGEGFTANLDSSTNAFIPQEGAMYISAGDDDLYKVEVVLSADQEGEAITFKKLKTSPGAGTISHGGVAAIKNGIVILGNDKTLDILSNVENISNEQNVPISDDIRDDFLSYNINDADMLYSDRSLFITLPHEGLLLEYDMRFGYWQPPQTISLSRLARIGGRLCGHSNNSNETYVLYDGYNDNGAPFLARAVFGYENFGSRFEYKNLTRLGAELKMSRNTVVKDRILYDYEGSRGDREFPIDTTDPKTVFSKTGNAGLGQEKLGNNPPGSSLEEIDDLLKVRVIHGTNLLDFFERQRILESDSPDCRFEILALVEDTELSDNEPTFIRK